MALVDLIRKRGNRESANDNLAKVANDRDQAGKPLAELAPLALANPGKEETVNLDCLAVGDMAQTSFKWWVEYYGDYPIAEASCSPAANGAVIEPSQPGSGKPLAPLNHNEEKVIREWLAHIRETDPEMIALVLEECRTNANARDYFLGRAAVVRRAAYLGDERRLCNQCTNLTAKGLCLAAPRGEIV
ncbi:hypothetical protein SAMN05216404_103301 [Nitrosospira multiformis]|uniref:Uncharacterized protein n=1 Tax=Nitrosospira multiformis TaxID=1231 RepID=A0A1H8FDW4_9PROT|nr:hypothetical protein [Nitrosospira multiformis]SEN29862.1 hypothetical protein SAMN05216404_103301 [Nitrosospira multiformis]